MTDLLLLSLYVGLSAAGSAVFIRSLPLVQRLIREGKKPWACDVCMSFWCTWLVVGVMEQLGESALAALAPGFAVALLVLRKLTEPLRPPPSLPTLEDSE